MTNGFQIKDGVLTVDGSLQYIKSQMFATRSDFRKAVICEGIGFLEEEVFAECENLEEVVLPESLINISVAAFTGSTRLKTINIPSGIKDIEEGAFLSCESLEEISFPDGLERIGDLSFQSTALRRIDIPESVLYIGEEAFFECEKLEEANVFNPSAEIGVNAFGSNYKLIKGYIAPGFSTEHTQSSELLYSLLWASSENLHDSDVSSRALRFISENENLIIERIFKYNNIPAMNGIANRHALKSANIDRYVKMSSDLGLTEITALLLKAKGDTRNTMGDFEL